MGILYVVQGFCEVGGDVVADKPILHGMEQLALTRGEMLAEQRDGVLVYAQAADIDRGEYSEPVILAQYGLVPHPEQQSLSLVGEKENRSAQRRALFACRRNIDKSLPQFPLHIWAVSSGVMQMS